MKTAVLGGTFDPVHDGHLAMARAALAQPDIGEVWFMPARKTPLKDRQITDEQDRLAMLDLAMHDQPDMKVSRLELERDGRSYTVETLEELHRLYPEKEFVWLIGADQAAQFSKWKDPDRLLELAEFACFARNGQQPECAYPMRIIEMEPVDISSTQVRNFEHLEYVDPDVLDYIYAHHLYLYDFMRSVMPQKRFEHCLMVAGLCRAMAVSNQVDENQAYLAGLLHDITKYMPAQKQEEWMEACAPQYLDTPRPVWHGFTGAWYVHEQMKIEDRQILSAIWHHVYGDGRNTLDKILFCADKLDPLRPYDSSAMLRACMENIDAGFEIVYSENQKYLKKEKKTR